MPASDAETVHTFDQLYSRYGFIMVCLIYLLLLAGDIELNPGPVPKEYVPKRTKEPVCPKILSNKTDLLSMSFNNLTRVYYGTTAGTI